ncbi:DUF6797 domain-containing protein [Symmachiella dynata]|uniref:DUF6797 domain-containing protein n=1 Tax=Symmachiella dynata TaxID=2527995 RepID=UPI0018D2D85C|nr:DUF6797 domain-containing protein [Symmachiella dynata]
MMRRSWLVMLCALLLCHSGLVAQAEDAPSKQNDIYAKDNLVAWCIVPFDNQKRSPEQRAAMLERLGIGKLAYDYRAEHVPTFDAEMEALKAHGIELTAWWFPTVLNDDARHILEVLKRHDIKTQLWVTGSGGPKTPADQQAWVQQETARIRPIAEAAAKIGCRVGLYNHGGWFGEPENQIAIIRALDLPNVGIVYNLHHGHAHVDKMPQLLKKMLPYLYAVNLNGMVRGGDQRGAKILPLGAGDLDAELLKTIRDSGYTGAIGILNHTQEDAEARLQDNLDGLSWLVGTLNGHPPSARPLYRSWQPKAAAALDGGKVYKGREEFRQPPITVECRVRLNRKNDFNILVACDEKKSPAHWEIFTMPRQGVLTAYLPGMSPDHVRSKAAICDNKPHTVAMVYEATRVRLYVDGKQVASQKFSAKGGAAIPGGLAIGRLVEGRLSCHGDIEWVRISTGARDIPHEPQQAVKKDASTLELWTFPKTVAVQQPPTTASEFNAGFVAETVAAAEKNGDFMRGAALFADAKTACLSCHKIGMQGGTVGPDLTMIGKQRKPEQIIESVFWPQRTVEPEFVSFTVITNAGKAIRGHKLREDKKTIVLRDPQTGVESTIPREEIDEIVPAGSLMPDGLTAAMTRQQQVDLIRFLTDLGRSDAAKPEALHMLLGHAHMHTPAPFEYDRAPLHPQDWPSWQQPVNRDRIYDFYAKQAAHFRKQKPTPPLLPDFPGLDGGELGHWGNQSETTWSDGRWNETRLGSVQSGVFHGGGVNVPRAVCMQLGDDNELSACFNPETLSYDAVWSGGFVKFSSVRHGFMHGLIMDGQPVKHEKSAKPDQPFVYHGFYRHGRRVVFAYRIGDVEYLDAPWVEDGKFTRVVAPADEHPLRELIQPGERQWPEVITTAVKPGTGRPYAVDTIELPFDNPSKALLFCGGHDFLPDGSALVCTMQGDVWHVSGFTDGGQQAQWQRFASGLHHALGLVVTDAGIFVQCRDQLVRLHDRNQDGEADYYECFSNAFETSPAGHDFICGLQCDDAGNFYTVSGNQGIVRISPDGKNVEVVATGLRNPDGLGILPDGTLTVPASEGDWTPASMVCAVRPSVKGQDGTPPYFGYQAPRDGKAPELPLVYLPRGLDNSSGGQAYIDSDRWGPLQGALVHLSFGGGRSFLLLRDEVDGQLQGAIVPLPGEFRSGAHRGRFNPQDGQLYVSGMAGWGSYTPDDGCFQRVRYTGDRVQLPIGFHVYQNGVTVKFTEPIDPAVAAKIENQFAQCWNYRYSGAYGSPEFSTRHHGMRGHDHLPITSAHVLPDGRSLFLEIPDLQPVSQLHLQLQVDAGEPRDMFLTVHRLDRPFSEYPGYRPVAKMVHPHPILSDLALATIRIRNPFMKAIPEARPITLETGKNLTFATRELRAKPGEAIRLNLVNPDVVPHNWALVKAGTLKSVGEMANRLVADPEAVARHYIPQTDDVLFYTDVVPPKSQFTIYFRAPKTPGRYPYLCTFPGHWMVMNGELIVE